MEEDRVGNISLKSVGRGRRKSKCYGKRLERFQALTREGNQGAPTREERDSVLGWKENMFALETVLLGRFWRIHVFRGRFEVFVMYWGGKDQERDNH